MIGRPGRRAALLVAIVAVLAAPVGLARLTLPDAPSPAGLTILDPIGMSGGTVIGSRADDTELEFLRSDAQPPCEATTP